MFCDSFIKRREDKDEKGEETIAFFGKRTSFKINVMGFKNRLSRSKIKYIVPGIILNLVGSKNQAMYIADCKNI